MIILLFYSVHNTKILQRKKVDFMKKYKVFVKGVYVGSTNLTPNEVSKLNNDTTIILK